jgi:hypothetical protein
MNAEQNLNKGWIAHNLAQGCEPSQVGCEHSASGCSNSTLTESPGAVGGYLELGARGLRSNSAKPL